MVMPKREPTKVVRVPAVLTDLFLHISALHKSGQIEALTAIEKEANRFKAGLVKKAGKLKTV